MNHISLPHIYSSGMILQRAQAINITGIGPSEESLTATFNGEQVTVKINRKGKFTLTFPAMDAADDLTMQFFINDELIHEITHIGIGEVWLAGGQSNMNLRLKFDQTFQEQPEAVLANLADENIRFYEAPRIFVDESPEAEQLRDQASWRQLTAENAPDVSAIAYYFSRQLTTQFPGIPVAFIWLAVDGTTASAWTSERALRQNPILKRIYLDGYDKVLANYEAGEYEQHLVNEANKIATHPNWDEFWDDVYAGKVPHDELENQFVSDPNLFGDSWLGPASENRPHVLFDNIVAPIICFPIKGLLWYQGESDDPHSEAYDILLTALINDWRNRWQAQFPVILMQLAPFHHWFGTFNGMPFPLLRARQQVVANTVPNVFLTNVIDAGDRWDVHPKDKKTAAKRFLLAALDGVYQTIHRGLPAQIEAVELDDQHTLSLTFDQPLQTTSADLADLLDVYLNGKLTAYHYELDGYTLTLSFTQEVPHDTNINIQYQEIDYSVAILHNENCVPVGPFTINL